jgi:hypothetical protein
LIGYTVEIQRKKHQEVKSSEKVAAMIAIFSCVPLKISKFKTEAFHHLKQMSREKKNQVSSFYTVFQIQILFMIVKFFFLVSWKQQTKAVRAGA